MTDNPILIIAEDVVHEKVNLNRWNLVGISWGVLSLEGSSFRGANMTGAELFLTRKRAPGRTSFSGYMTDFSYATLRGAHIVAGDFRRASFERADLRDANFAGCDLSGACFLGADLRGARFYRCFMWGALVDERTQIDEMTDFLDTQLPEGLRDNYRR